MHGPDEASAPKLCSLELCSLELCRRELCGEGSVREVRCGHATRPRTGGRACVIGQEAGGGRRRGKRGCGEAGGGRREAGGRREQYVPVDRP